MITEKHKLEHGVPAPNGEIAQCHTRYVLDESEIRRALRKVDRRCQSPTRVAVESGVAAVVGLVAIVDFIRYPQNAQNLVVGLLCLGLAALAWGYGPWSVRRLAKAEAAKGQKVHLWLCENGVGFGKHENRYVLREYEHIFALKDGEDLLVLIPDKNALIAAPRCAFAEADWARLCERVTVVEDRRGILYWKRGGRRR